MAAGRPALGADLRPRRAPACRRSSATRAPSPRPRGCAGWTSPTGRLGRAAPAAAAPLALPLLGSSLERGLDVAEAMAARGYGAGPRTRVPERAYGRAERAVLALGAALARGGGRGARPRRSRRYAYYPTPRPAPARPARSRWPRPSLAALGGAALALRAAPVIAARGRGPVASPTAGRRRPALDGVDLDAGAPARCCCSRGPPGEGKSTLLRALCGLVPHFHGGRFAGRVTVAGLDTLTTRPARDRAGSPGWSSRTPRARRCSARWSATWPSGWRAPASPGGDIPGRVRRGAGARRRGATCAGRAIATLSGGERQRVALAAVLAPRPGGAAAWTSRPRSSTTTRPRRLARVLRRLADGGAAVVVAEHRPERARPMADRLVAVRGGRLEAAAPDAARAGGAGAVPGRAGPGRARGHRRRPPRACRCCAGRAWRCAPGGSRPCAARTAAARAPCCGCSPGSTAPEAGRVRVAGRDVTDAAGRAPLPRGRARGSGPGPAPADRARRRRGRLRARPPAAARRGAPQRGSPRPSTQLDLAPARRPAPARPVGGPARAGRPRRRSWPPRPARDRARRAHPRHGPRPQGGPGGPAARAGRRGRGRGRGDPRRRRSPAPPATSPWRWRAGRRVGACPGAGSRGGGSVSASATVRRCAGPGPGARAWSPWSAGATAPRSWRSSPPSARSRPRGGSSSRPSRASSRSRSTCIVAGAALGPRAGLAVGPIAGLISNSFLGQGPWTPPQMALWAAAGLTGALLRPVCRRRGGAGASSPGSGG